MCEVADGATLTINGPLEAPMARIFGGGGKVVFGSGRVESVYPQWWGAQTDDGLDDASAIQAAIDSLCYAGKRSSEHVPPNNGVVSFPAGRYEILSTLRFYDGTTLEGGAHNRTELYAAKPLPAILQRPNLSPPAQGQRYNDAARINGVRIARLILNGKSSAVGLDLTNVGYALVEHVTVRECKTGIRMSQFAMHNTLLNPAIAYCDTGIEIDQGADHTCIFGGRISGGSIGILVKVASGLDVYAMSFEAYKETGVDIREGDSVNLQHPWFASTLPTTAIKIGPLVSACTIVNPRFHGSTPKLIDDQAKDTAILDLAKDGRKRD